MPLFLVLLAAIALQHHASTVSAEDESLELLEYSHTITGDAGTIVPIHVRFHGEPQNDYEASAWFYGDGQWPSEVWDGDRFQRSAYQPLTLNTSGDWDGWLYLRLKFQPPEGSYLKVRVRNASDTGDRIDLQTYDFTLPEEWGWVTGFAGSGTTPANNTGIELRTDGILVAANLTAPAPWAPWDPPGRFRLAAPAGDYTLRLADSGREMNITITTNETTYIEFGYTPPLSQKILIEWLYYNPWQSGEEDEAIALWNPGLEEADLSGWRVTDWTGCAYFPEGARLAPGTRLVAARNATAFRYSHGYWPDYQFTFDGSTVPVMGGDSPPQWSNNGEIAILHDRSNVIIDAVAYGNTTLPDGWNGTPAPTVPEGVYLHRDNDHGLGYRDTDIAADWQPLREYRPGQTQLAPTTHTATALVAFASPDATYEVLAETLRNATESIALSLYYLNHTALVDELIAAAERGVEVQVLLEGSPVSGFSAGDGYHATRLSAAGAEVWLMRRDEAPTRYPYLHAKYCIIDERYALVMSENWGHTGVPISRQGNRGWGMVLDAPSLSAALREVFEADINVTRGDIISATVLEPVMETPPPAREFNGDYADLHPPLRLDTPVEVQLVVGPDTTLHNDTILSLLNRANETIIIEQHQFTVWWRDRDSAYLVALVEAARRGVSVRVLLDATTQSVAENNQYAYFTLCEAADEGLPLTVRLYRGINFSRIHNKGVIVDGRWTLVSSINWGVGGGAWNREIGVIIDSPQVAAYYATLFEHDWTAAETAEPPTDTPPSRRFTDDSLAALEASLLVATIMMVALFRRR